MAEQEEQLLIAVELEGGDDAQVAQLSRELRSQITNLNVDAVEDVSLGQPPAGKKAADWVAIGQIAVTLAPVVVPPLVELIKSWVERKPSVPVKVTVKSGNKSATVAWDPTKTRAEDVDTILKTLGKTLAKAGK
jgi:hypothetical protein